MNLKDKNAAPFFDGFYIVSLDHNLIGAAFLVNISCGKWFIEVYSRKFQMLRMKLSFSINEKPLQPIGAMEYDCYEDN